MAFLTGAPFFTTDFLAITFLTGVFEAEVFFAGAFLATAFFAAVFFAEALGFTLFLSALNTATIVLWFFLSHSADAMAIL